MKWFFAYTVVLPLIFTAVGFCTVTGNTLHIPPEKKIDFMLDFYISIAEVAQALLQGLF